MIYVGLDIASKTGLAIIDPNHPRKGRVVDTYQIKSKHKGIKRAEDIWEQCSDIIFKGLPSDRPFSKHCKVFIEGYGFARVQNIIPLAEIGTIIRYNLWSDGVKYIEVPPTSLKKFVTGKGNVKKEHMLKEVYKRFDIDCETNDEADAVGLAYFGMALDGINLGLPQLNMDALKKFVDNN